MESKLNQISAVLEGLVKALFAVIVVYLLVLTAFTTATLDTVEHTTLIPASPLEKLLVMVICGGMALGLGCALRLEKRRNWLNDSRADRMHTVLLMALGLFAVLFILSAQRKPNADQYLVVDTASRWRNGDFSDFQPGGYLKLFPHQCGLVLIYYLLSFLVGQHNYIALQLLNAFAQVLLAKTFGDLAAEATGHKQTRIGVDLAFLAFLPLTIYGTFVYGNWPGLALSIAALAQAARLRKDKKKIRILRISLLMLGALCFKENCLIPGIAAALYLGLAFLRDRKAVLLAAMSALILVLLFYGSAVRGAARLVTGQELGSGTSKWSYVQMGLTENDRMFNGWWNKYIQDTYEESGYDTAAQEARVMEELKARVSELRAAPDQALRFFAGKNASQWANPDFGSIFKNHVMHPVHEEAVSPGWIYWMLSLEARAPFRVFMGAVQTAVLFGALLSLLLPGRKKELVFSLQAALIGGFLFHTVWEAKGQYTLSYFILLLPLAVQGYEALACLALSGPKKPDRRAAIRLSSALGCLALLGLLVQFADVPLLQTLFKPWM